MLDGGPSCEAVLPVEATRGLELMVCSAAWVAPQQVSSLVKLLNERVRQPVLAHLKRVAGRRPPPDGTPVRDGPTVCVLLWHGGPDALGALPADVREALGAFGLEPVAVSVPRHGAMTREQFCGWNKHWPLTYHESAVQHALAAWPPPPPATERVAMAAHMRTAIELAKQAAADGGRRAVAALIVRPGGGGDDDSGGGATGGGGGGGGEGAAQVLAACTDATCCVGGEGGGHPLHHALMVAIEEVARQQRRAQPPPAAAAAAAGSKRAAPSGDADVTASGGGGGAGSREAYLCTGCDAYITLEPCAMCAMALAHSRIRRLVYAVPCAAQGALGSRYRLHTERSINHHFQVYRGLLCDEARAALQVDESTAA